ncbi:DUF4004 family protein [Rossellomorea marisflavi]|uniref:DUF4004 family protein n=1 Tax=Rossellomorea marisflavi TaxID=189381 RepID=UPI00064E1E5C|nr:DUF4004 family protein [Rossellomorea marisflavi]KML30009.1 hypothetical protein VL12_18790 [Rossellomorea marisflavi]QHA35650.1 DUF4004 family protein [Rossellomorea marisflavi]USK93559.1 YhbD family protein [Rossellomorea marisflavi]
MSEELISKREVLDMTGISYGQLYRWKRKNILPESWFIKKSSFTGQETYFPKEKVLERIQKIKELKDDHSLDELSAIFSPDSSTIQLSGKQVRELNLIPEDLWNLFQARETFTGQDLLHGKILHIAKEEGVEEEALKELVSFLESSPPPLDYRLIGMSKGSGWMWMQLPGDSKWVMEESVKAVEMDIGSLMEQVNGSIATK